MKPLRLVFSALLVLSFAACGDDDDGDPIDGSLIDGGRADGGNPDGSTQTDGGTTTVRDSIIVDCPSTLQAPATGTCAVTSTGSAGLLVKSTILAPGRVLVNGQLLIGADGKIACAECDCSGSAGAASATVVECAQAVVSPGLINPHDHITFTNTPPHPPQTRRYNHRHEWRRTCPNDPTTELGTLGTANGRQVAWGELRQIISGTTSLVGSGSADNFMRNLDVAGERQEGLGQPAARFETFPLGDAQCPLVETGCTYPKWPATMSIDQHAAYLPHVSEGINARAQNEFTCISADGHDLVQDKSAFIHSIGITAADAQKLASDGTTVIWSPRSNIDLYGNTAQVTMLDRMGVEIALGTDWVPSGSLNMLRELSCARFLNQGYFGSHFSIEDLWKMSTLHAARAAAMDDAVGSLAPGLFGDIAIYATRGSRLRHRAVLEAEPEDVVLVLRGGTVMFGDAPLVTAIDSAGGSACDMEDVCGTPKRFCVSREIAGMTLQALRTAAQNTDATRPMEPLFHCDPPSNEPVCKPSRPNEYTGDLSVADPDGDGREGVADNCPAVFNPIRPMDGTAQPDADMDGLGDVCDPCPLDANTTTCSTGPNPNDTDRDTILNATDNCPTVANTDQMNRDGDALGDACDPCPTSAAAGTCAVSIHDLRDPALGRTQFGPTIRLAGIHVLHVRSVGFYARDATGRDYGGIWVYTRTAPMASGQAVVPGMIVTVDGAAVVFSGNVDQFNATAVTMDAATGGNTTPIVVTTAELAANRGEPLESLLIQINNVQVAKDEANDDDFQISALSGETCATLPDPDCARVTDFILATGGGTDNIPATAVGQSFSSVTGIVDDFSDRNSIALRTLADLAP